MKILSSSKLFSTLSFFFFPRECIWLQSKQYDTASFHWQSHKQRCLRAAIHLYEGAVKMALFINPALPSHCPSLDLLNTTKFYIFKVHPLINLDYISNQPHVTCLLIEYTDVCTIFNHPENTQHIHYGIFHFKISSFFFNFDKSRGLLQICWIGLCSSLLPLLCFLNWGL